MVKFYSVLLTAVLFLGISTSACSQAAEDEGEMQWQHMNVEIIDVYDTTPVTMEISAKDLTGKTTAYGLTIDPGCEFYINDELASAGANAMSPGDAAKIQYVVNEGEKVAFKVSVTK